MLNLSRDTCINISVLAVLILVFLSVIRSITKNETFTIGGVVNQSVLFENKDKEQSKTIKKRKSAKDTVTSGPKYTHLGCFRDYGSRLLTSLDSDSPNYNPNILDGQYKQRVDAINKCYNAAKDKGMALFALQDDGSCYGEFNLNTYNLLGKPNENLNNANLTSYPPSNCLNGRGGAWTNDVYKINY